MLIKLIITFFIFVRKVITNLYLDSFKKNTKSEQDKHTAVNRGRWVMKQAQTRVPEVLTLKVRGPYRVLLLGLSCCLHLLISVGRCWQPCLDWKITLEVNFTTHSMLVRQKNHTNILPNLSLLIVFDMDLKETLILEKMVTVQ